MKERPFVYICSPFRPISPSPKTELTINISLARDACTLACYRGYTPIAPHLYFPQFLRDDMEAERKLGLSIGLQLISRCQELWIVSRRISVGMSAEIKEAQRAGVRVLVFTADGFRRYSGTGDVTDNCMKDTLDGVKN